MVGLIGLLIIAVAVTLLPLLVRRVGENLELFLFLVGILAVTVTSQWSLPLVLTALEGPLKITAAVLIASLLFHFLQGPIEAGISALGARVGKRTLVACLIVLVGLASSFITAIIASLIMVEALGRLKLDQKRETRAAILACFSIGLGAALTPFGEPLSTVAITKLSGEPYYADTWFLLRMLWMYVIPMIALLAAAAFVLLGRPSSLQAPVSREERETIPLALLRTLKVYVFVAGLILLGQGFTPLIQQYIGQVSYLALYWANITSAVLDNATLAAAEIVPTMQPHQITAALMGLLIAGGMLVPGNIPNIIAASRLKIESREWARFGVPVGMVLMVGIFLILLAVG